MSSVRHGAKGATTAVSACLVLTRTCSRHSEVNSTGWRVGRSHTLWQKARLTLVFAASRWCSPDALGPVVLSPIASRGNGTTTEVDAAAVEGGNLRDGHRRKGQQSCGDLAQLGPQLGSADGDTASGSARTKEAHDAAT